MARARTPLDRDRIVRAAVDLADRSGVEAVTMRQLGHELGFEAMSLYRYIANKDDLLDGMLDLVLAEWQLPRDADEWRESVRTSARSVHDALRRHRWAARLLMTGMRPRPARLEYMEWLLGRLREAGFDLDRTYSVYHLLDGFVFGYTLWEIAYTGAALDDEEIVARVMSTIPWDDLPHLTEHRDQHLADGPHREASAFEVGLDLILQGLSRTLGLASEPAA
jgi:AcrR family transcriptional regulator